MWFRQAGSDAVVRAAVRAIAFATRAVVEAAEAVTGAVHDRPLVAGGAIQRDTFAQWQGDLLDRRLVRSEVAETAALGVGFPAGLSGRVCDSLDDRDRCRTQGRIFTPSVDPGAVDDAYQRWREVVESVVDCHAPGWLFTRYSVFVRNIYRRTPGAPAVSGRPCRAGEPVVDPPEPGNPWSATIPVTKA